jgi:hypothetical protein
LRVVDLGVLPREGGDVMELEGDRVGREEVGDPTGPLDARKAVAVHVRLEAELHEFVGGLHAVGVEVVERPVAVVVDGEDRKGGTADLGGGQPKALRDPFYEVGFARPQVAVQRDHGARGKPLRDAGPERHGVFHRVGRSGEAVLDGIGLCRGHVGHEP